MQLLRFCKTALMVVPFVAMGVFGADFGNTTLYGSTNNSSTDRRAQQVTMPTGGGTITSVAMYHAAGTTGKSMILGVYSNGTNNLPNTRLAYTATTQIATTAGWQTIPLISSIPVTGGTKLWLAWICQTNPGIRYKSGTPARASTSVSWSTTGDNMPPTFGTSTNTVGNIFSIYATYTVFVPEAYYKLTSIANSKVIDNGAVATNGSSIYHKTNDPALTGCQQWRIISIGTSGNYKLVSGGAACFSVNVVFLLKIDYAWQPGPLFL